MQEDTHGKSEMMIISKFLMKPTNIMDEANSDHELRNEGTQTKTD